MYEKVTPSTIDKIADRVAGAMTDLVYSHQMYPHIHIDVSIDNNTFTIISKSSYRFLEYEVLDIVEKITGLNDININLKCYPPDSFVINGQGKVKKCGNTGIYKAYPVKPEQEKLSNVIRSFYDFYQTPGEYLADKTRIIILQSLGNKETMEQSIKNLYKKITINPLCDEWVQTIKTSSGHSNNRIASDLGIASKGIHGRDLGYSDVTLAIYAFMKAQETKKPVEIFCSIGDDIVDGKFYSEIVEEVQKYIDDLGGFEALAEWGVV